MIKILLVEDNPGDVLLTKEAFRDSLLEISFDIASDGVAAIDYLQSHKPDMILLDLNLPKKDGREVLAEIKSHEKLKSIPVIILTTSKAETDILQSYQLHANCYITKPVELDEFTNLMRTFEKFWLSMVKLPHE